MRAEEYHTLFDNCILTGNV